MLSQRPISWAPGCPLHCCSSLSVNRSWINKNNYWPFSTKRTKIWSRTHISRDFLCRPEWVRWCKSGCLRCRSRRTQPWPWPYFLSAHHCVTLTSSSLRFLSLSFPPFSCGLVTHFVIPHFEVSVEATFIIWQK